MAEPTKEQRTLYKKLREIIQDDALLRGVMAFAMNLEAEQILIEAIEKGDLTEEEDFYSLLELAFEDSQQE